MDLVEEVLAKRLAAVVGDVKVHSEDVDPLVVRRVDADLAEVERPRVEARSSASSVSPPSSERKTPPALALALADRRSSSLVGLDDRVDDPRVLRGRRRGRSAGLRRQALRQLRPGRPAVRRPEDPAGVAPARERRAGGERPGRPLPRVERRLERVGVRRVHDDVAAARLRVVGRGCREDLLPGLPAVGRPDRGRVRPLVQRLPEGGDVRRLRGPTGGRRSAPIVRLDVRPTFVQVAPPSVER